MKKIIFTLLFIATISVAKSQTITDTAAYLIDSIQAKKAYYIGKPLSTLLHDLRISIKSYLPMTPIPSLPDTIPFASTVLSFYYLNTIMNKMYLRQKDLNIHIRFNTPILIPKTSFMIGGFFYGTEWTTQKANFFGQYILSDINVRGL